MFTTCEAVTPGHPDKLCDQISDAILDAHLTRDPNARVACEVMATKDKLIIAGEITSTATVDYKATAQNVIADTGYVGVWEYQPEIINTLNTQSENIARHTNPTLKEKQGAGDQGIMFGYAHNPSTGLHPAHEAATKIVRLMTRLHNQNPNKWGPDGKTQVTWDDIKNKPVTIIASQQHGIPLHEAREELSNNIRHLLPDAQTITINPGGQFNIGGPTADTGLTGRKIIADTYAGVARHGGGAFSGKDPSKVDRSAALAARQAAKWLARAYQTTKVEVALAYAIGIPEPVSIQVRDHTGYRADMTREAIHRFEFTPHAITHRLKLTRPTWTETAKYGAFTNPEFEWEKTDKS